MEKTDNNTARNLRTNSGSIPLCVDLDGTLIAGDTLLENVFIAVKMKPLILFLFPFWILKGKAFFKSKVSGLAKIDPSILPYRQNVIDYLNSEKAAGREIILATATHYSIADSVAEHLGIFSRVLATRDSVNLRAENKKRKLEELFGHKGFDYAGDSKMDLPVWAASRNAILVEPSSSLLNKAKKEANVNLVFQDKKNKFKCFIKEIRVHQWIKNVLILLPLLMAHRFHEPKLFLDSIFAFFAFSLCASFVYVVNDLLDLESDRHHPRKKNRPLASGALSLQTGIITAPILLLCGLGISLFLLPVKFNLALIIYLLLTGAYSFNLKKIYILDIIVLAALYTLRLIAGALAVDVEISPWLLAFSMFLFLSLAVVKRYTELRVMKQNNKTHSKGRGYIIEDIGLLRNIGVTSGYISVLVLVLYVHSADVIRLYKMPSLMLPVAICLLFWITRIWFLADRGEMEDDPIVFTGKDPVSYIIGLIVLILVIGAALL